MLILSSCLMTVILLLLWLFNALQARTVDGSWQ